MTKSDAMLFNSTLNKYGKTGFFSYVLKNGITNHIVYNLRKMCIVLFFNHINLKVWKITISFDMFLK